MMKFDRAIAKKAWIDCNLEEHAIWPYDQAISGQSPKVITFYSFKGGMGRTTAMAATMLMDKTEFIDRIHMDIWDENTREKLPASTPEGIFEMLERLGIILIARDGRVNVPEIYLHGFGMKRKGGLRRPK